MDIKEFVSKTLVQITEGVIEAQEKAKGVNPVIWAQSDGASKGKNYATSSNSIAQFIDFDIALVTEVSENKDTGGSIKVAGISLGREEEVKNQESITSRVKFQVLVEFPQVR